MKKNMKIAYAALRISAILLVLALTAALGLTLFAAENTVTLTVKVNPEDKSLISAYELRWSYNDLSGTVTDVVETDTGYVFHGIRPNSDVRLYITTAPGHRLQGGDQSKAKFNSDGEGTYYYWGLFDGDTISLSFVSAIYDVVFLGSGRGPRGYSILTPDYDPNAQKYIYGDTNRTKLPAIEEAGYTFQNKWNVVAAPEGDILRTVEAENGEFYLPKDISSEEIHESGKLYVYPVMLGDPQPVIRRDYVSLDGGKTKVEDWMLGTSESWTLPTLTEYVTGLFKDSTETDGYKSYVGFRLITDPEVYKDGAIRIAKVEAGKENPNVVERYYEPISYELHYDLGGGNIFYDPDENGVSDHPQRYLYGTECTVYPPTRIGYDFAGWEVDVKNEAGETVTHKYTDVVDDFISSEGVISNRDPQGYASSDGRIVLRAVWVPKEYGISYDLSDVTLESDIESNDLRLPKSFTFGFMQDGGEYLDIPAPIRSGYSFRGWILAYRDVAGEPRDDDFSIRLQSGYYTADGTFSLPTTRYACEILMTPLWEENSYAVVLDGNDAATISTVIMGSTQIKSQVFDHTFGIVGTVVAPISEGYKFMGFFSEPEGGKQYIDAYGKQVEGITWTEYKTNEDGAVVLYAHWEVCFYTVGMTFAAGDLPEGVNAEDVRVYLSHKLSENAAGEEVWSEFALLGASGVSLAFGTEFRLRIECPEGYKTVRIGESSDAVLAIVPHANPYVSDPPMTVKSRNMTLRAMILPMIAPLDPNEVKIDYVKETVSGFPDGSYRLSFGDSKLVVRVANGIISIDGQPGATDAVIPNAFFGNTVELYRCGDSVKWADSEPQPLSFAARPEAPEKTWFGVDTKTEDRLHVLLDQFPSTLDSSLYEFAISTSDDPTGIPAALWQKDPKNLMRFGNGEDDVVRPGTSYYVFARVHAVKDVAPHGEACVIIADPTEYKEYRAEKLDYLNGILEEPWCGENVEKLINDTRAEIENLIAAVEKGIEEGTLDKEDVSIWRDVEAILEAFEEKLALEKEKDISSEKLLDFLESARECGRYNDTNLARLEECYSIVISMIKEAKDIDAVQKLYAQADEEMRSIPVRVIYDSTNTVKVETTLGLPYTGTVTVTREEELDKLLESIRNAINSDKLTAHDGVSTEEARAILSELDTVAYYRFILDQATVKRGDTLRITLTIPEDLRSHTGLRVLYFDPDTGEAKLVASDEVAVNGDTLVFYADGVSEFAILADSSVDLGAVIIALACILLGQAIVLAFLLSAYLKKKQGATNAAVAFPLISLAIKFAPNGAVIAVWVMGLLACLMQIAIVLLILRGRVAYVPRQKKEKKVKPLKAADLDEEEYDDEEYEDEDYEDEEYDEEDLDGEDYDEEELDEEDLEEEDYGDEDYDEADLAEEEDLEEELEEDLEEELEEDLEENLEEDLDEEAPIEDINGEAAFDEEPLDEMYDEDDLYEDEPLEELENADLDEDLFYEDAPYAEDGVSAEENERMFISKDGEVFYGESEETEGMEEFDPKKSARADGAEESEASEEESESDESDEDFYKYDE